MRFKAMSLILVLVAAGGCARANKQSFGDDLEFLKKHCEDVVVLTDNEGTGQVAVIPQMQGRVMTSTAGGPKGRSFGWINR